MARKNSFTKSSQQGGDNVSRSVGNNRACVEPGKIYTGQVSTCLHGDQLYHVAIDGGGMLENCLWAAGMFSGLFGFKTTFYPPVGTRVSILAGNPSFIISTLPSGRRDSTGGEERIMTSTGEGRGGFDGGSKTRAGRFHTPPMDMLEGEFEIGNEVGVAIQFLSNLIAIKGSERAKIEAHLLDDMVRIVSDTFKHFNAFGDYQIYNDGGLNMRWDGTSREWEGLGLSDESSQKADISNRKVNFTDDLYSTGRWRFSQFVGFLGDFIHTFVSDPQVALSNIGDSASPRAGKSRVWMGNDGTILAQSVTEIALERVCRIVVPVEKKRWDDPDGLKKSAWKNMVNSGKQFTKVWNYGSNYKDVYKASFQLREYARWLSHYHSYARFHQYATASSGSPEWEVGGESDVNHSWTNREPDVEQTNQHLGPAYLDAYACIRIMRDGAILCWDGYGSAISMVRGMVQVSSTRHLDFQAAGDIRLVAGNDIYIKARRHVEITAIVGGIIAKSRTMWKALCEWGSIWLKSDAVDPEKESPPSPDDPQNDPEPEIHDAAIILDTSRGKTIVNSKRKVLVQCYGQPDSDDLSDTSASVIIQSKQQDVRGIGKRCAMIKAETKLCTVEGRKGIAIWGPKVNLNASVFDINKQFTYKNGTLNAIKIRANVIGAQSRLAGPLPVAWVDRNQLRPGYHRHGNHVSQPSGSDTPQFATGTDTEPGDTYKGLNITYRSGFTQDGEEGPIWNFNINDYDWKQYNDSFGNTGTDDMIQSLAQQRINFDDTLSGYYSDWSFSSIDKLKNGPRTESDTPFPGANGKHLTHESGQDPLHTPTSKTHAEFAPDIKTDLKSTSITFKFLKKN
jgi:hypothetical protein